MSRVVLLGFALLACAPGAAPRAPGAPARAACGGAPLRVNFYDVGQALAVLVILPDGRRLLVDAGESPKRPGCGEACRLANEHLLTELQKDLGDRPIDLLWITHQHSDHLGGVPELAAHFRVLAYVDNGQDLAKKSVERARDAVAGAKISVVDPAHAVAPLASDAPVTLHAVVPKQWPGDCAHDANDCSIALRIDYCKSSVLFVGDAEAPEEAALEPVAATLLQVGHHGSHTSSTEGFLARVHPRYAVISSGKPGEAMNASFCHPRAATVEKLAHALGGPTTGKVRAFGGQSCKDEGESAFRDVPTPATLFSTARDGDVRLVTTGDGAFARE